MAFLGMINVSHVTGGTICAERTAIVKAVVGAYFFQHIAFYSRRAL